MCQEMPCEIAPQPKLNEIEPQRMEIIRNIVRPLIGSLRESFVGPCFDFVFNETTSAHSRLMQEATQAAPKPLSMLTTVTFDAQEFNMPSNAATPAKLAP